MKEHGYRYTFEQWVRQPDGTETRAIKSGEVDAYSDLIDLILMNKDVNWLVYQAFSREPHFWGEAEIAKIRYYEHEY